MYGIQDKINQILRGAEPIRKNQSMQPLQHVNSTTTFFAGKYPKEKTNEDSISMPSDKSSLQAQSDPLALYHALCDMTKDLIEKTNEVERLMEELQRLKSLAQAVVDRWETPAWKDAEPTASVIYRLRDALAPAPEETVSLLCLICHEIQKTCSSGLCEECKEPFNPTCDNTTHKFSHCDCKNTQPDHLHHWMRLQESINLDIAEELKFFRYQIQKLKQANNK